MLRYSGRIILATCIGILYFIYLYYSEEGIVPFMLAEFKYLAASVLIANFVSFCLYLSDDNLNQLISWKRLPALRFVTGFVLNGVIAIGLSTVVTGLVIALFSDNYDFVGLWEIHQDMAIKLGIITLIGVFIYSVVYFLLYSYNQYAVVQIDSVKKERKQLSLQFEALKSQLSPHYLFNCMNTISSLIFKDPDHAEDFIRRLVLTYQYILTTNKCKFVTLAEEIEFVKSYNYLLKVRFENNLRLDIDLPPSILNTKIPPLTLQILVENAVKHNMISKQKPLEVKITTDRKSVV